MAAALTSNQSYGSDENGLVCGFVFEAGKDGKPLSADAAIAWLAEPTATLDQASKSFVWLHFNLANTAAERWLQRSLSLSPEFYDALRDGSRSTRVEYADDQLVAVLNDVLFDFSFDHSQVSTLVLNVSQRVLVTGRSKTLRSIDQLRVAVKAGERFPSSTALLVHLLRDQSDVLTGIVRSSVEKLDVIEDRFLAGRIETKRAELAQLRRVLVRLK